MKNLLIITLIATLVGSITATEARADREGRALVGGLIGGLIIGSILDNDHHHHSHTTVRYKSGHRHGGCGCRGHHDYISVRTWVNGHWSIHYDHCGNRYRDWIPGYYTYTKKRVWVPHHSRCDYYSPPRHHHHDDHYRGRGRH